MNPNFPYAGEPPTWPDFATQPDSSTRPDRPTRPGSAARLDRAVWPDVPAAGALVLVPVGSTEQHGPHLPFTTDTVIARAVADRVAASLDGPVLVTPAIAFGSSGEHAGFPGTISIGHEALRFVLVETVRSLALWAERIVFVNGHGGNVRTLDDAVPVMRAEGHRVAWTPCVFPGGDAHAGRTETSLMLHLSPSEVRLPLAAPGNTSSLAELMPDLIRYGVRPLAPTGVLGDPTGATEAEGRALLSALVGTTARRVAAFTADARGRLTDPPPRPVPQSAVPSAAQPAGPPRTRPAAPSATQPAAPSAVRLAGGEERA